ncbi:MAG: amidophosphoribosyltransferase [Thermoanaerobaculia bacterium]|nr:MAG: amidophosphoribosyltransferase [Thermoanaerobaculia bacterium]
MCGIFGIEGQDDAANHVYLGLYALQHRGQESTGIVTWDGARVGLERGMGHVADVFPAEVLARLPGRRAIGHTRYSTSGSSVVANAQPIVVRTSMGSIGVVHNGNLTNAVALRRRLEAAGSIFQTTSDTEVILHLMARNPRAEVVDSLLVALAEVEGAYSLLMITEHGLIAARDPNGFRPLAMARRNGAVCFGSESCAFDLLGAAFERELEPGELVVARDGEVSSHRVPRAASPRRCVFEHVYFARPDSMVFGDSVAQVRTRLGAQLAREAPAAADVVVPVPDSGLFAALGYSRESGLPFELGMTRNHYVGRTFIEPKQSIRNFGVKVKLNPVQAIIRGRRVVLIDDSIVRGTTSRKIVRMVREAGAAEVHLRISSPPTAWPCFYGIDTPRRGELIAATHTLEEIRAFIEADSVAYLSLEGLLACVTGPRSSYCTACWSGDYPVSITGEDRRQAELFPVADEEIRP